MVQRTLAARSLSHAQGGTLFAGFLKLLPMFLLVLPGMISRVLFTGLLFININCFKVIEDFVASVRYDKMIIRCYLVVYIYVRKLIHIAAQLHSA